MAIPSGSGTEVLKRYLKESQDDTESTAITGVANHIYTILSIIATNQDSSNSHVFYIKVNDLFLTRDAISVGANETFVWNDKFVLSGHLQYRWSRFRHFLNLLIQGDLHWVVYALLNHRFCHK